MKQKLKEFKRQLLRNIQVRLLRFLRTEYRTQEELDKERMGSYLTELSAFSGSTFSYDGGWYAGDVLHIRGNDGITYYKNNKTGLWINLDNSEEITDDEFQIRLGLKTEVDQKFINKMKDQNA